MKVSTSLNTSYSASAPGRYYAKILQVNHYIDQVANGCEFLSDAQRNYWLAPAYGIRAYYYFMLYRTYGGVPLETSVKIMEGKVEITDLYMARATAEETINFIKEDINRSESCYGSDRTLDRHAWSYFATEMLKAQIYLWSAKVTTNDGKGAHNATGSSDLNVAKTALQNIVSSGQFALLDDFSKIFAYNNKGNKEEIFAIYFNNTETTNLAPYFVFQAALTVGALYDEDGNLLGDPLNLCNSGMHRHEYREALIRSSPLIRPTRLYLDMGTGETEGDLRPLCAMFETAKLLSRAGAEVAADVIPGAHHNEAAWEKRIPTFLPYLLRE